MAKNQRPFSPGTKAPVSGQYGIRGPKGGKTNYGQRTVVDGEPFPPTPEPGMKYVLEDRTKPGKQ